MAQCGVIDHSGRHMRGRGGLRAGGWRRVERKRAGTISILARAVKAGQSGATMIEYALVIALVAAVISVSAALLGQGISQLFDSAESFISGGSSGAAGPQGGGGPGGNPGKNGKGIGDGIGGGQGHKG